ncbi:MAG: M56 family metallopeptidase [Fimbriimonadaceae bacterium]|nr:M56 family metallopeptidase [Fimbriimonadaceae bacterium]
MTFPFDSDLVQRLGTAALHFLWQGAILGILAFVAARAIPSAAKRYAVLYASLVAMAACPILTLALTASEPSVGVSGLVGAGVASDLGLWAGLLWLTGVAIGSVRLAGGWAYLQWQLRRSACAPTRPVRESLVRMSERLGVRRVVSLVISPRVESPSTTGWLRAVIYLPAATLARLTPDQLDAVLAHELAHIRRFDFLMNLIQRAIETLLFFHPAVWWISSRIRIEREHCCDDEAVAALGCPATYANALLQLEVCRSPAFAVAATDGDLLSRLKRIGRRDEYRPSRQASTVWSAVFAFCLLASLGMSARPKTVGSQVPRPSERKIEEDRFVFLSAPGQLKDGDKVFIVPFVPPVLPSDNVKTIRIERRVSSSPAPTGHIERIVTTTVHNGGEVYVTASSSSSSVSYSSSSSGMSWSSAPE